MNIAPEKLARYTAELKCGIGFLAFLLYDMYGPIPLPDMETLKNPVVDNILPRATEEEMRTYIETNLKEAAAILPYKYDASDYGRFTKGLANTLLLKFYMRIGDWNNAVVVGEELTTDKEYGYQVVEDYNSLFTLDTERNMEVIFCGAGNRRLYGEQLDCPCVARRFSYSVRPVQMGRI